MTQLRSNPIKEATQSKVLAPFGAHPHNAPVVRTDQSSRRLGANRDGQPRYFDRWIEERRGRLIERRKRRRFEIRPRRALVSGTIERDIVVRVIHDVRIRLIDAAIAAIAVADVGPDSRASVGDRAVILQPGQQPLPSRWIAREIFDFGNP